jgi:DNA modification methylase
MNNPTAVDIRCADCREFLSGLPDNSIDLVFTSPSYNIGSRAPRNDGFRRIGSFDPKSFGGIRDYPDEQPEQDYQDWQVAVLDLLAQKLKLDGTLVYNHKLRRRNKEIIHPLQWIQRCTVLVLADELVWDRGSTHNHDVTMFWPHTERLFVLRRRDGTYRFRNRAELKFRSDLWRVPVSNKTPIGHPSAFPLALAEAVVTAFTKAGDLVCDPFSGSGSTAVVALTSERQFTGCDIKPDYVARSIERVPIALGLEAEPSPLRQPVPPVDLELPSENIIIAASALASLASLDAEQARRIPTPLGQESSTPKDQAIQKSRKETAQPKQLRSYQDRGATWLYEHDAAFAVAQLGAGKSTIALTALADLIRDGHRRHGLIIAPKLVATTVWPAEVAAWPHLKHLRIAVLNGSPERRRALLATAHERELTAIGVDLVQWLVEELAALPDDHPLFDLLIIDETSKLKDPSGKRSRALLKIAGRWRTRWGLTGTPRPNSSQDLFAPAAIVTDGALWGRAFIPWQKAHFRLRNPATEEWVPFPGAEEKIAAEFGTVAMTVADEDMPDLPPLNIVETQITLPDPVMASYRSMARELFATVEGRSIEAISQMVATGKLAQLANGFLYGEGGNEDAVPVHDLKIDWLRELVESLAGEPLLVAYEFVEDLRTIRRALGEVPTLSNATAKEAARLIEAWNAGALPLLAFAPASAAHGLNLQFGGSRMAWLSPSWSAELTEQAIARIYRSGQTRHVTIHVCIAARTVDEMKRDRVLGKMSAQEAFRRHLEAI